MILFIMILSLDYSINYIVTQVLNSAQVILSFFFILEFILAETFADKHAR